MSADNPTPRRMCGTTPAISRELELDANLRRRSFDLENATRARRGTNVMVDRGLITIPVYVHVIYNTDDENISDPQVFSQIDVLNQDFRATNPDIANVPAVWRNLAADSQIEFRLEQITRTQTTRTQFGGDDSMKFAASGGRAVVTPSTHLNIWVCNLQPWLGYAYFPGVRDAIDGVVVRYDAFGTTGAAAAPFNLGRTATHEIGHYLNLHHIWGGNMATCSDSDLVSDTPNQRGPNEGEPTYPSISCNNGPHGDMFMNYMDYVDDKAMFMFTAQQVLRMRTALSQARPGLGTV